MYRFGVLNGEVVVTYNFIVIGRMDSLSEAQDYCEQFN